MARRSVAAFYGALVFSLISPSLSRAICPIETLLIKGTVENAPAGVVVRVQLLYPKKNGGDSGETTVVDGGFSIPIQFLTQSRRPSINGLFEKCDRKPSSILVSLAQKDQAEERDRVVLDLVRDFAKTDSTTYELRSKIILKWPQ